MPKQNSLLLYLSVKTVANASVEKQQKKSIIMLKCKCKELQWIQLFLTNHANQHSKTLKIEDDNQRLALPTAYLSIQEDNSDYTGICEIVLLLNS